MQIFGKMLIIFGAVLAALGFLLMFSDRIPFLGKLPGDICIRKENFQLYFPLTTSIIISLLLSLLFWLISLISKK